ncbi:MAG TPA: hypothetical protein VIT23_17460, partial [Terrimicrobiaceae bacterium]
VVFLGLEVVDGVEIVRFWSSNRPDGFGQSSVPRKQIAFAIFSRLEHPQRISEWAKLSESDPYLANLLTVESSFPEAKEMSGIRGER